MHSRVRLATCAFAAAAALIRTDAARADEQAVLSGLAEFLRTSDVNRRTEIARAIGADPAFHRARVSEWLHRAAAFPALSSGRNALSYTRADDARRDVVLRMPSGYDSSRPWPLIYALHGAGGDADSIIRYVEKLLGRDVEKFVVAAPDQYDEMIVHQKIWPPLNEHSAALAAIRTAVHVDGNRVYAAGYSKGGHAAWTLAVLFPDEFAGVIPLAGTLLIETSDRLWETFLPSTANTRVLCVWGAGDVEDSAGGASAAGGIAGLNRRLKPLCERLKLPVTMIELPGVGHGGVEPPRDALNALLAAKRETWPKRVRVAFRHIIQARNAWLEGVQWTGPQWDDSTLSIELPPGRSVSDPNAVQDAFASAIRRRLGELSGEIDGNTLKVRRKNVSELIVWIGDGMIDWRKPVTLTVNGGNAFAGELAPDLLLCLTQAAATRDFERLRWAGLRYRSGDRARIVSADDESAKPDRGPTRPARSPPRP